MNSPNPYAPPKAPVADAVEGEETALASRGQRLGAAFLDGLISMIWTVPLGLAFGIWSAAFRHQTPPYRDSLAMTVIGFILFAVVNLHFLRSNGQTIGKKLVGIRIVTLNYTVPDLDRLLGLRYGVMWGASMIPGIGPLFSLVDILFIFGASRRCVHDLIAGTKVVRVWQTATP